MYYVMLNKQSEELLIISDDDYLAYDSQLDLAYNFQLKEEIDNNPIITHSIIFASSYDKCLKYCERRIGYKE